MTDRKVTVNETDLRRDALQKAYNGMCSVLGRLAEAGWGDSSLARDAEDLRAQLADVAFVHCVTCGWPARFHPEEHP